MHEHDLSEGDCSQQKIVLFSDSLSALQSLTNGPTDLRTQQLHNIHNITAAIQYTYTIYTTACVLCQTTTE